MKILIVAVNREIQPDPVFPIGAAYIAYHLQKAGHHIVIFDACFLENPEQDLEACVHAEKPEIIAFSIRNVDNVAFPNAVNYLPYYKNLIRICRQSSQAQIILGGSGFSIFPELFMAELSADYGIKGEGEYALIELLDNLQHHRNIENRLIYSSRIKDINFNDFPDRQGFNIAKYYEKSGCLNIQTKRGCAFACSYCTYPVLEGHSYRLRTPGKVVDELEYWHQEKEIKYFFFVDNVFNHPEDYALNICNEIIRRNLKINWTGFFIPKLQGREFVSACKESGCTSMDFGTDAFSGKTLKGFNKDFTVDDIFNACRLCEEEDLKFNHSIIFGGPGETGETLAETIQNIDLTGPTSVIAFIGVRLYSGTPLALQMKDLNIGIEPVFYIAEEVQEFILEYLQEKLSERNNWIIPGLNKGFYPNLFAKLRKKGIKGPLWEMLSKIEVISPLLKK